MICSLKCCYYFSVGDWPAACTALTSSVLIENSLTMVHDHDEWQAEYDTRRNELQESECEQAHEAIRVGLRTYKDRVFMSELLHHLQIDGGGIKPKKSKNPPSSALYWPEAPTDEDGTVSWEFYFKIFKNHVLEKNLIKHSASPSNCSSIRFTYYLD